MLQSTTWNRNCNGTASLTHELLFVCTPVLSRAFALLFLFQLLLLFFTTGAGKKTCLEGQRSNNIITAITVDKNPTFFCFKFIVVQLVLFLLCMHRFFSGHHKGLVTRLAVVRSTDGGSENFRRFSKKKNLSVPRNENEWWRSYPFQKAQHRERPSKTTASVLCVKRLNFRIVIKKEAISGCRIW